MIDYNKPLEVVVKIRAAKQILAASFKEQRRAYRIRAKHLEELENRCFNAMEENPQMELFDSSMTFSEETKKLLEDPLRPL